MKKLFVAMPYGRRKAPLDEDKADATVEIDFDAVWREVLQPAGPKDFETRRTDELRQPGLIDRLYSEWLFDADIVLADLTFGNPNVYYELGIRQALSKKATVLVACQGTNLPFDVRNQYVINYDYFAAPNLRAFQTKLRESIRNASGQALEPGLTVGRFDDGMSPENGIFKLRQRVGELEDERNKRESRDQIDRWIRKLKEATSGSRVFGLYRLAAGQPTSSVDMLEQLAIRLRQFGYFDQALEVLKQGMKIDPRDPEILRELGFVYRKKGPMHHLEAERYMIEALELNDADAELHGMLGGLLKRKDNYIQALVHYRRANELEPENLYPIVNLGGISAVLGDMDAAIRWYGLLRDQCNKLIVSHKADYWTYLCLGESSVVLGKEEEAVKAYLEASKMDPPSEDLRSAIEQLEFLLKNNVGAEIAGGVLTSQQENPDSR